MASPRVARDTRLCVLPLSLLYLAPFSHGWQNYFYPDTPKNYQITQYDRPIAEHGEIVLPSGKKVRRRNTPSKAAASKAAFFVRAIRVRSGETG